MANLFSNSLSGKIHDKGTDFTHDDVLLIEESEFDHDVAIACCNLQDYLDIYGIFDEN